MNEDLLIQKFIKMEEDVGVIKERLSDLGQEMVTKEEYLRGQDQIIQILTKTETERAAIIEHNKRVDAKLELHEMGITSLKQKVNTHN